LNYLGTDPVDLLIFDCPITENHPANPNFKKLHPLLSTIGQVAQAAGVSNLLLSHLSPNTLEYMHTEVIPVIRQAGYTGKIKVAKDLAIYNLNRPPVNFPWGGTALKHEPPS
jgi:ribonuclease BN (tRNA processing enzyme)